ncbi:beta-glucosidase-domain-containing protein [Xylariaceae sp. FL0804]|nr:beta-glucosidase-domain-containing protein [Xylariaceae sp. FL0804]
MKTATMQAALGSAILMLAVPATADAAHHRHQNRHHSLHTERRTEAVTREFSTLNNATNPRYESRKADGIGKRGATCEFPSNKGAISITPGSTNAGWALSPDMECADGKWCPIACPPGQVMNQWKPDTTYVVGESTCGGIYCNGGNIEVPFEDEPWCVDGTGSVQAVNNCGDVISFCQTVLPGYEDMIIPTDVYDTATLAVPSTSYWDATAAHFYVNPPGVSSAEGCVWGDASKPVGNWSPYVAGANTDSSGNTFVKLGINPIWQSSGLAGTPPTFGLKIECDGDSCVGLPCSVQAGGDGVTSELAATGAGGADFCVVTVTGSGKASIVAYNLDGSSGSGGGNGESPSSSSPAATSAPSTTSTPTPTPTPSTTSVPTTTSTPTTTSSSTTSTSSTPTTTSTPSSTSTSSSSTSTTTTSSSSSSSIPVPTSTSTSLSSSSSSSSFVPETSSSRKASPTGLGGVFAQQFNGTHSSNSSASATTATTGGGSGGGEPAGALQSATSSGESAATESNPSSSAQRQGEGAVAGLIIAFVAAVCLL